MARLLAARGITAFVLFYRLPHEGWASGPGHAARRRAAGDAPDPPPRLRATASIRRGSARWASRPAAMSAPICSTRFDAQVYAPVDAADRLSARPDLAAPIYPVVSMTAADRPCRLAPQPDRRERLARARARPFAAPQRAGRTRRRPSSSTPRTMRRSLVENSLLLRAALAGEEGAGRDPSLPRRRPRLRPSAGARERRSRAGRICSSPGPARRDCSSDDETDRRLAAPRRPRRPGVGAEPRRDRADDEAGDDLHGREGRRPRAAMSGPICPTCRAAGARSRRSRA